MPIGIVPLLNGKQPLLEIALIPGELYPELSVGGVERYEGADFPEAPVEAPIKRMMKAPWDDKSRWIKNAPKRWYGEVNSIGPGAAPVIARTLQELFAAR